MKNKFLLFTMFFLAVACLSCNKDDDNNSNDSTNPSNFDTYAEIEAYCLENGWTECSLINNVGTPVNCITNLEECFTLYFALNGTLSQNQYNSPYATGRYKLTSSFNALLELNAPPVDGYINSFTCDNEKFGICMCSEYNGGQLVGYSKFYIKRINQETIKIFFKKCDWPTEE